MNFNHPWLSAGRSLELNCVSEAKGSARGSREAVIRSQPQQLRWGTKVLVIEQILDAQLQASFANLDTANKVQGYVVIHGSGVYLGVNGAIAPLLED